MIKLHIVTPKRRRMGKVMNPAVVTPAIIKAAKQQLCFYKAEGQLFVRRKSSLTGKRVKKDAAFQLTMRNAGVFGRAAALASEVYEQVPKLQRNRALYNEMLRTTRARLAEGMLAEEAKALLIAMFVVKATVLKPLPVKALKHPFPVKKLKQPLPVKTLKQLLPISVPQPAPGQQATSLTLQGCLFLFDRQRSNKKRHPWRVSQVPRPRALRRRVA